MFSQKIPYYYSFPAIILSTLLVMLLIYAWTEPTQAPPGGNVPSPLNVGPAGQSKEGGLILNTGGAGTGLIVATGNVGIGTTEPAGKLHVKSAGVDSIVVSTSTGNVGIKGKLEIGDSTAFIEKSGSDLVFTDPNAGTKKLSELGTGGGAIVTYQMSASSYKESESVYLSKTKTFACPSGTPTVTSFTGGTYCTNSISGGTISMTAKVQQGVGYLIGPGSCKIDSNYATDNCTHLPDMCFFCWIKSCTIQFQCNQLIVVP